MLNKLYSVQELSELADASPELLGYLHEIGLLVPRSQAPLGAARYDDVNLLRLQQIRMGRARGLALEEIRRWLDAGTHGGLGAAAAAHAPAPAPGAKLDGPQPLYVEAEAKVETEADREAFLHEAGQLYASLSAKRRAGMAPVDTRFGRWTERHRCHINRWFRPCDARSHVAFGRAIAKNPHLSASIEHYGRNLTAFMISVIEAHTP